MFTKTCSADINKNFVFAGQRSKKSLKSSIKMAIATFLSGIKKETQAPHLNLSVKFKIELLLSKIPTIFFLPPLANP